VRAKLVFDGVQQDELHVEDGWTSSCYGVRRQAAVLLARARRRCPATFGYSIEPATG
jgi:hypothetical protein